MITIKYKQDMLDKVPERFNKQYNNYNLGTSNRVIAEQLLSLTKPIDAKTIDVIIGNTAWTSFTCDACDTEVDTLIYMESKYYDGYEGAHAHMCKNCITKMLNLMETSNEPI